ncbi:MAG: O-antigen ligase family protein [Mesonia hippocampi]|uniref:O-antigen ligase family protein n=1 Tax=Mesonia hippocampi TaxID=1628250 RepID=UPI003F9B48B9
MEINKLKQHFFNWSLAMVFITLPMPKYSLSTQAFIVLCIAWLLQSSFKEKALTIKKNLASLALLSGLYIVLILGMLYTQNTSHGLEQLKDKLPFLLLPFIMATNQENLLKNKYNFVKIFSISVVLMAVFAFLKASYMYMQGLGSYFVYDKLALLLDKHTTYYSLYCVIALVYFVYDMLYLKRTNKFLSLLGIVVLLVFIYLLSARIAILALLLVAIYFIKIQITQKRQKVFLSLIVITALLSTLLFSSNYVARFESISENPDKITENNELNTRLVHWKSALETLKPINYLIGKGTGDGKENLYNQYLKNDFLVGYKNKYNAHNEYIELLMSNGFIGVFSYIILLLTALVYAIRMNDIFGILIVLLFFMYGITESILERQSGILIVALLCSIIHFSNKKKLEINN